MFKTALLTVGALVICIVAVVAWSSLTGSSSSKKTTTSSAQRITVRPQKSPTPWHGGATKIVNTAFLRSQYGNRNEPTTVTATDTLNFTTMKFTGLNTLATTVKINLIVTSDPIGQKQPQWLNDQTFKAVLTPSEEYYNPQVTIQPNGGAYQVSVVFKRMPTEALGTLCSGAVNPSPALGLLVFGPDGVFALQLLAPDPPDGHCLGEISTGTPAQAYPENAAIRQALTKANQRADGTTPIPSEKQ